MISPNLQHTLDKIYSEFDFEGRMSFDPIKFPKKYNRPEDIELSAFISSCFAYGQVNVFMSVIDRILSICGSSPYDFLLSFELDKHRKFFSGIKYRFNETQDIICLFYCLKMILQKQDSLKSAFLSKFKTQDANIISALESFIEEFLSIDTTVIYGKNIKPFGLRQFIPLPHAKSPCKRLNLFLRWMVRDRDIDFGLWTEIPKDRLIIPLDTHIARISKCLGLTNRSSVDMKTAIEITESLKQLDPQDPLKYDFSLCHLGISGICSKKKCLECNIKAD